MAQLALLLLLTTFRLTASQDCTCPDPSSTSLHLTGLFAVHSPGTSPFTCGSSLNGRGWLQAQAFLFAARTFPQRYSLLQDADVQGQVLDTCDSVPQLTQRLLSDENCNPDSILGYVGPERDSHVEQLVPLAAALDKTLLSVSPPGGALESSIIAVLLQLNWKHIQLIHSADRHESFTQAARQAGICIVNAQPVDDVSGRGVDDAMASVPKYPKTQAVVLLVPDSTVRRLLLATDSRHAGFTWLGSWADSTAAIDGAEAAAIGAISIGPDVDLEPFRQYLSALRPAQVNSTAPWLWEYWQSECRAGLVPCALQNLEAPYLGYTVQAVDSMLLGLERARASYCSGSSLCDSFMDNPSKWRQVTERVAEQTPSYTVYNFRQQSGYQKVRIYITYLKEDKGYFTPGSVISGGSFITVYSL